MAKSPHIDKRVWGPKIRPPLARRYRTWRRFGSPLR
jgi:hypothetical protein